jgi:hypothetical protein
VILDAQIGKEPGSVRENGPVFLMLFSDPTTVQQAFLDDGFAENGQGVGAIRRRWSRPAGTGQIPKGYSDPIPRSVGSSDGESQRDAEIMKPAQEERRTMTEQVRKRSDRGRPSVRGQPGMPDRRDGKFTCSL